MCTRPLLAAKGPGYEAKSQPGSPGKSSSQSIEKINVTVEGEISHLQSPQQCSVINSNNVTVMYSNAGSLIPKYDELCVHNLGMICTVEAWLTWLLSI